MGTPDRPYPRAASTALVDRLGRAPVVVLTGARQTGKTTLARSFPGATGRRYLTLDALTTLDQARSAPESVVDVTAPLTIDEVQRAPDLLIAVKRRVDEHRRKGAFLLTGSANLLLMKGVSETLAGRTAPLVLRPMTPRELRRDPRPPVWGALIRSPSAALAAEAIPAPEPFEWRPYAMRGGFPPAALSEDESDRVAWFEGYVQTYVQRDLRDLAQVADLPGFVRLMRLVALRTGGLLNHADLAADSALPRTTVQRWLSLLETSYLVTILPPFFESKAKRLIKTPKLFGLDTGLGLYLTGASGLSDIDATPKAGAWLEQLVLNDVLAWRDLELRRPGVYFRRTASGEEIDLVIESGRRLLPIEVKSARAARASDARALEAFCDEFGARAPFGLLLYDGRELLRLTDRVLAVPLGAIL